MIFWGRRTWTIVNIHATALEYVPVTNDEAQTVETYRNVCIITKSHCPICYHEFMEQYSIGDIIAHLRSHGDCWQSAVNRATQRLLDILRYTMFGWHNWPLSWAGRLKNLLVLLVFSHAHMCKHWLASRNGNLLLRNAEILIHFSRHLCAICRGFVKRDVNCHDNEFSIGLQLQWIYHKFRLSCHFATSWPDNETHPTKGPHDFDSFALKLYKWTEQPKMLMIYQPLNFSFF